MLIEQLIPKHKVEIGVSVMSSKRLEIMAIQNQNDIEKERWKSHGYLIDFESRIDIELPTLSRCQCFDVEFQCQIDDESTKMRPLGC